ncbi:UDP-N-acetylmuramate dehydrogenase [Companilactobacillus alimentarius]|uniref:UDP-N-acetylenolpyruvoylglucosamine reductase n=1 Tax=Companilactobacillus alimentarius DSM 20249 TaxID=1423720 RepID=A0A2K9HEH4_9LACO|nr:UDP-N-acetylmuramate dehydrogenase [Companilactobacillus alimentarius]AUI70768.1 UDP-N-acetylenolpyruvoylglucosamine reductase [Companilactobacillus alimentarius DSM 20249]KRK76805.1 UDP-N-acetylenolpyruvoylglucosamine reductase [Companilactobacillus alimentarius DSM 20249]GEO45971.1 UDP-N-acetylenolpyruvoylglucosamine reductase [Companilactobacillus alimentarius]
MNFPVEKLPNIEFKINEPLSKYTFTKTGGNADVLAFPKTREELVEIVDTARVNKVKITIIGNASNLIIKDGGIRGIVIILPNFHKITVTDTEVTAEAGATIINTTIAAQKAGLTGIEFAAGIPGSVGGAVFMNAGAYGGEIKDVFESAEVLLPDGHITTLTHDDMKFSYRHSLVQDDGGIVISATFALKRGNKEVIQEEMDRLNALRRSKQPLEYPSCGSVFKRPKGHFTGPLIIKAGLQGKIVGGAQVSMKHAGFIVNIKHATATDYMNLIHLIQKTVKEKFDVELHTEVRIIGEDKK